MNSRTTIYRKLAAAACAAVAACAEPVSETPPVPETGTAQVILRQEGAQDVTVYAFRRQGDVFRYDTLFRDGWTSDGRLSVRMTGGEYKFLFACGAGENLALDPAPAKGGTTWEEAAFSLREDPASPGTCLPADELFLQYPSADANRVYTVKGIAQTIPAHLSRAVCRIGISLKRGYRDGDSYVEIPYAAPQSILDAIDRIDLTARNAGRQASPDGYGGTAEVSASFPAAEAGKLTDEGFVVLDGPFVIPPADGADLDLELTITPAAGSHLQPARLRLGGKAERNKRLDVTLWITSAYPTLGIEIRLDPIGREQEGDAGIWE